MRGTNSRAEQSRLSGKGITTFYVLRLRTGRGSRAGSKTTFNWNRNEELRRKKGKTTRASGSEVAITARLSTFDLRIWPDEKRGSLPISLPLLFMSMSTNTIAGRPSLACKESRGSEQEESGWVGKGQSNRPSPVRCPSSNELGSWHASGTPPSLPVTLPCSFLPSPPIPKLSLPLHLVRCVFLRSSLQ